MDTLKNIALFITIMLLTSLVHGQDVQYPNDSAVHYVDPTAQQQSLTLNALKHISRGSEEFSLELLQV